MSPYASDTSVPIERSRAEIEEMLRRLGSDQIGVVQERLQAVVFFRYNGANFRFTLPLPTADDSAVKFTASNKLRSPSDREAIRLQLTRSRWRSLFLTIKAMLVGVEAGIFEFAEIFLPYLIWGDGRTTAQTLLPDVEEAFKSGRPLPKIGQRLLSGERSS